MFPSLPIDWHSHWAQTLEFAAYVLVAGTVTVHVLLRRSAVPAALGWIGLAWLSPFLGGLVYYVFGINRVSRRGSKLARGGEARGTDQPAPARPPVSPHIAALAPIGRRITASPLSAGNRIAILETGDEAYPAMLEAIAGATKSIALASYIFRDDDAGRDFSDALIAAKARGVEVRVLLDSIGVGYFRPGTLRRLKRGGVSAARFLHTWVPWRMPFLNMRNHKKLLIVDGALGFTGGLNIGAENLARAPIAERVGDIHMRIEGPVVRQLMESFARDWSFTAEEELSGDVWWPALATTGDGFARGIDSGPDADIYKLEALLGAALAQAKARIRIVTPYFLPDDRLLFAIALAQLRGVTVDIVIPEKTDYFFLDWAMRAHLRFFSRAPESIYLSPRPFDHAKLMTVDGEWGLIGSSNWDTRSLRLNFEFDLECYDHKFVTALDLLIDARIAHGTKLDREALMAAPRWRRLRDAFVRLLLPYL